MCSPGTKSVSSCCPSVLWPSEFAASTWSANSFMSLLCLELCPPGEVSLSAGWVTLIVGVGSRARVVVCPLVARGTDEAEMTGFATGSEQAADALVRLGLGIVLVIGADMVGINLVFCRLLGTVLVVSVVRVWLSLALSWACSWVALRMAVGLGMGFELFFVGNGSLSLGGGRPADEGMSAWDLVILDGVCGWLVRAANAPAFFFFAGRVPRTISRTWQEKHEC